MIEELGCGITSLSLFFYKSNSSLVLFAFRLELLFLLAWLIKLAIGKQSFRTLSLNGINFGIGLALSTGLLIYEASNVFEKVPNFYFEITLIGISLLVVLVSFFKWYKEHSVIGRFRFLINMVLFSPIAWLLVVINLILFIFMNGPLTKAFLSIYARC